MRLLNLHIAYGETKRLFTSDFLIATRESFTYDILGRAFEGMGVLRHAPRPSDDVAGIRRSALDKRHDGGWVWRYPLSFDMNSSRGLRRRNIIRRLYPSVEKDGYIVSLEKNAGRDESKGTKENEVYVFWWIFAEGISFRISSGRRGKEIRDEETPAESWICRSSLPLQNP